MAVDLDAEYSVIGSLLKEPEILPRLLARVDPRDFSSDVCRLAFQAARSLFQAGRAVDPITIRDAIGKEHSAFLSECMDVTPTAANWQEYADAMHSQAVLMRIHAHAMALSSAATLDDCREAVSAINAEFGAGRRLESWTVEQLLMGFSERQHADRAKQYITYGLPPIDAGTYTEKGDIVMIGGAPSDGKTAFALATAWHMAQTHNVGFFSLETGREKLEDRLVASGFQIDLGRIKRQSLTEEEWTRFAAGTPDAVKRRLRVFRASGVTVEQITATAAIYGLEIIFVDYVQLIRPEQTRGVSRADQMAAVSQALHTFAQSSGTLVVELAQLSRQDRKDKRERDMFDLGESSQFEKDADLILLLYRPGPNTHYVEDDKHSETLDPKTTRILKIAKNKEGLWGRFPLAFDGARQSFSVLAENSYLAVQRAVRAERRKRPDAEPEQMELKEIKDEGGLPF